MTTARRSCIVVVTVGSGTLLWLSAVTRSAASLHPTLSPAPAGRSAIVEANLRFIGTALYTYTNENLDAFPPQLSMLFPQYITNPAVFWSPGDTDPCPTSINNDEPNAVNGAQISYRYFGGSSDYPPYIVLEDSTLTQNGGAGFHALISTAESRFFTASNDPPAFTATARGHLTQIGAALQRYAADHQGHYPQLLSALFPAYISDPLVFWNPGDKYPFEGPPPTTIDNDVVNAPNSAQTSYVYNGTGLTTSSDPGILLVQDNSLANNGGIVTNVLTAGMNVATYFPDVGCTDALSCRTLALNNLRGIATAMYTYANENSDDFPTRLSMLIESGAVFSPTTWWNPGDTNPRPLFIDNEIPDHDNSTQISYAYFGGTADLNPLRVVLQDNSLANNQGQGLIVVTTDSTTQFFEKSTWTQPAIEIAKANLAQIGQALHAYAAANGGQFPAQLSLLYPAYISDPRVFWNPGDSNPPPTTIDNDLQDKPNSAQISFHYRGFAYTSDCPGGVVLVEDNSLANNGGAGINVLTADGRVDFYAPDDPACTTPYVCINLAAGKLRNIGLALFAYAQEHHGLLPPALSALYPQLVLRPKDFWDAGDSNPAPTTIDNDEPDQPNSAQISFRYLAAGQNLNTLPSSTVLVRDETPLSYGGNESLELRADGSVYPAAVRHLISVTISGPERVVEGATAKYVCMGAFDDGAVQDVTSTTGLSIYSGQGTFVPPGVYLAPPTVPGDSAVTLRTEFYTANVYKVTMRTIVVQPSPTRDSDGDGVPDGYDRCPNTIHGVSVDADGCPATMFGDANRTGSIDAADLAMFTACRSGAAVPASFACATAFDHDRDGDVDQDDFGIFQRCYAGAGKPADPNCVE